MSNNNISEIPENRLYQFDEYHYVFRTKMNSSRGGNYSIGKPLDITEVYEDDGTFLNCIASGRLSQNPYTSSNDFSIFDYDQDTMYTFGVTMLKEAGKEELIKLRNNISQMYNKRNK